MANRGHNCSKAKTFLLSFVCLFLTSQQSLLRQQERVEERVQEIEEQLCKLDSDKCVMEVCYGNVLCGCDYTHFHRFYTVLRNKLNFHGVDVCVSMFVSLQDRVCELKEEVRLQYQRMHQLLEDDLRRALEALDRAQSRFCQENTAQILTLGEQRHEAQKLLSSIHTSFSKAEELSFMKNTKPVKILTDR